MSPECALAKNYPLSLERCTKRAPRTVKVAARTGHDTGQGNRDLAVLQLSRKDSLDDRL